MCAQNAPSPKYQLPPDEPPDGKALVVKLREKLMLRFWREVSAVAQKYNRPVHDLRGCLEGVIAEDEMFGPEWLDMYLPLPQAEKPHLFAGAKVNAAAHAKVSNKSLPEWWDLCLGQLLVWCRKQPWGNCGEGIWEYLGDLFLEIGPLWPTQPTTRLVLPATDTDPIQTVTSVLDFMKAILTRLARRERWVLRRALQLDYDPAGAEHDVSISVATATCASDRTIMVERVRWLAKQFHGGIPDLEERFAGRGTLQLLRVADQLEVALLRGPFGQAWGLHTLNKWSFAEIGQKARPHPLVPKTVEVKLSNFRKKARQALADLWLS
jgi:hypothetical protein